MENKYKQTEGTAGESTPKRHFNEHNLMHFTSDMDYHNHLKQMGVDPLKKQGVESKVEYNYYF
ncbi:MAG: hypothetical protein ACP5NZ_02240 [Nanobdellota archaeon]